MASLLLTNLPGNTEFQQIPNMPVSVGRRVLSEIFMRSKCDYLLFIDNDCEFHPGAITRMMEHDAPIICGGMWTRTVPVRATIGVYLGRTKDHRDIYNWEPYYLDLCAYLEKHEIKSVDSNAVMFPEKELREYDGCGMHFTMIRRDVFEAVKPPWFVMQGHTEAGEDFYFCKKAKDEGFQVLTDLSIQTGHLAGDDNSFGIREMLVQERIAKTGIVSDRMTLEIG